MTRPPQGPKRREWEKLKRKNDRLSAEIADFNRDLASLIANNPHCANLPTKPIPCSAMPEPLPPMPRWTE